MIEPGAAEDQLAQPVAERLGVQLVDRAGPGAQVLAEPAARMGGGAGRGQLDQVVGLVGGQVALRHQLQPHRRRDHPLGEVGARESVAVVEELDDEIVAGVVVSVHGREV
jgi:hypothetical protein